MRTLALPSLVPASVLSDCIGGVSDPALMSRLGAIKATLVDTACQYDKLARSQDLHLMPRATVIGAVAKGDLENLYTDQMSAVRGAGRSYYNAIRNAPANGKCPLCGVGNVAVLDHHLPKSKYPDLAVCPFNLVPACDFCNNAKKARFPSRRSEQTIHPYYDDFTKEQWVFAHLDMAGSPVIVFSVHPPLTWPSVDRERVRRHFDVVNLAVTFTSNANDDLITLKNRLTGIYATKGQDGVQAYLGDERDRHRNRLNSWQHTMYQALAASLWFVTGGFLKIPGD